MKAYLNGEEYIFSGGGSSQEIYSTEETRIGTWIDGKPLYRKVFISRNIVGVTSQAVVTIGTISNAESVRMTGVLSGVDDAFSAVDMAVPFTQNDVYAHISYDRTTNALRFIYIYGNESRKYDIMIIFEYTKTTD